MGVLGEESVARMNGLGIGDFGGADDMRDIEVAFGAGSRTDADRFVGEADMQAVCIRLAVDRDCGNA